MSTTTKKEEGFCRRAKWKKGNGRFGENRAKERESEAVEENQLDLPLVDSRD